MKPIYKMKCIHKALNMKAIVLFIAHTNILQEFSQIHIPVKNNRISARTSEDHLIWDS